MLKKIFEVLKKIVFGILLLYGYNMLAISFDLTIPINIITILLVSFLGLPALFSLILILILVF